MGLNGLKTVFREIIGISLKKNSKSSEKVGKINEVKKEKERPQLALDSDRTKNVNDVEPFKKIIRNILELCLKDSSINKPDDFFQCVTRKLVINVLDFNWLNKAPKNIKELEEIIKELGMWKEYCSKFAKYYRVKFEKPIKSNRIGIKRIPIYKEENEQFECMII